MKISTLTICPILNRLFADTANSYNSDKNGIKNDSDQILEMSLEKVIIIHRHGERTSCAPPLDYAHLFPLNWGLCTSESNTFHRSDGTSFLIQTTGDHRLHDNVKIENHEGMCYSGQLTDKGKETMRKLGNRLSYEYPNLIDSKNFEKETFFRATEFKRAIESLQYLLRGWFPDQKHHRIHVHDRSHENLLAPIHCSACMRLEKQLEDDYESTAIPSDKNLRERYPEIMRSPNKFGDLITIYAAFDTIECRRAHNLSLPFNFTNTDLQILKNYYIHGDFKKFQNSKFRRLYIGRFLEELVENVFFDSQKKLYVYSAHDSSLIPILLTLGYELTFPDYGSYITIEVYKNNDSDQEKENNSKKDQQDKWGILLKFNGEIFKPNECSNALCTEKEFKSILEPLIPKDYTKECRE